MATRNRRERAVFELGHIGENRHALGARAGEPLIGVIVGVVDVTVYRKSAVVEAASNRGLDLFDEVGSRDEDSAGGEGGVNGLQNRIADDAIELESGLGLGAWRRRAGNLALQFPSSDTP